MTDRLATPSLVTLAPRQSVLPNGGGDALSNAIVAKLPDGACCYVTAAKALYRLDKSSAATADGVNILAPSSGVGRWFREATNSVYSTRVVRSLADLPDPVAGVITMPATPAIYEVEGIVALGLNTIVCPSYTVWQGRDRGLDGFISTAAAAALDFQAGGSIDGISVMSLGVVGSIGAHFDAATAVSITQAAFLGLDIAIDLDGASALEIDGVSCTSCTHGIVMGGVFDNSVLDSILIDLAAGVTPIGIDILAGSTLGAFILDNSIIQTIVASTALAIDNGIVPTEGGIVSNCVLGGAGTKLSGVNVGSLGWSFRDNAGLGDTTARASMGWNDQSAATPIGGSDAAFVAIPGNYTTDSGLSRFTNIGPGVWRYDGTDPITVLVEASASLQTAAGTGVAVLAIGQDGVAIGATGIAETADSTTTHALSTHATLSIVQNSTIQIMANNYAGVNALQVRASRLTVTQIP
jgi:hypothetical protein